VWWADEPRGDPHAVLLLSWDTNKDWRTKVTVASITRTQRGLDAEVHLGPDDGMPDYCVVNLDELVTITRDLLYDRICQLKPRRMAEVEIAAHNALGMTVPCNVGWG
jgi:mRNA-degrading endonuclease toxin of MazEF toxin-antitoxin module